jgi:hypothetical protein
MIRVVFGDRVTTCPQLAALIRTLPPFRKVKKRGIAAATRCTRHVDGSSASFGTLSARLGNESPLKIWTTFVRGGRDAQAHYFGTDIWCGIRPCRNRT